MAADEAARAAAKIMEVHCMLICAAVGKVRAIVVEIWLNGRPAEQQATVIYQSRLQPSRARYRQHRQSTADTGIETPTSDLILNLSGMMARWYDAEGSEQVLARSHAVIHQTNAPCRSRKKYGMMYVVPSTAERHTEQSSIEDGDSHSHVIHSAH